MALTMKTNMNSPPQASDHFRLDLYVPNLVILTTVISIVVFIVGYSTRFIFSMRP
jgi:hypothetical protein